MSTVLRRILMMAFIAVLAGLGVFFTALLGRRPRKQAVVPAEVLVPVLPKGPIPAKAHGGQGLAVGIVCLLVLMGSAGVIYESRNVLFGGGPREPRGPVKPLAALSPPDAGSARPQGRSDGSTTGSVRASPRADEAVTLQPSRPPAPTAPGFDVVRVEPNGDAIIAGHATPTATVELLLDGKPAGRVRANADGRFTFMPPALPTGNSEIGLRATDAKGDMQRAPANVSVVVAPSRDAKPLVAVTSPGRPTMVLSQPDRPGTTNPGSVIASDRQAQRDDGDAPTRPDVGPPASDEAKAERPHSSDTGPLATIDALAVPAGHGSREPDGSTGNTSNGSSNPGNRSRPVEGTVAAAKPPRVVTIDAQDGGRLFVTARAAAGAEGRLYLNDTLIAPATVGRDGTVTFAIGHGVRPGYYKVRLDLVDPATGKVSDRAEVPFTAPAAGHDEGVEYAVGQSSSGGSTSVNDVARRGPSVDPANPSRPSTPGGSAAGSSKVTVPGIETARIERGDSLWRISRRTYGEGERYTLIYDANQDQIRHPDLIYPGQILVLPDRETSRAERIKKRG